MGKRSVWWEQKTLFYDLLNGGNYSIFRIKRQKAVAVRKISMAAETVKNNQLRRMSNETYTNRKRWHNTKNGNFYRFYPQSKWSLWTTNGGNQLVSLRSIKKIFDEIVCLQYETEVRTASGYVFGRRVCLKILIRSKNWNRF